MRLAFSTVAELATLLRRGDVSPVELTRTCLDRLERLGPHYNAVASLTAERALADARRAEAELRRGHDRGPLHGIPYGAKDLLAARGAPTTWGAAPYREQVFEQDAAVVRRLARAGAVLAAKLAMVELAGGGGYRYASASLQGPGRNPWHMDHWSGGSSSGSGAAVAAGLVPFALGSETSGSIVTPASYCGVTGLRPTYGLVSRHGAMALSWTLDKLGPMAHTAEDCGLVLAAIAGADRHDPGSAGRSFRSRFSRTSDISHLRIGYAPADFDELADESARSTFAEALAAFRSLGAPLVEVNLPADLPYGPVVSTIINAEGSAIFAGLIESDAFEELADAKQKAGLRAGLSISARDYLDAMRIRRLIQEAFHAIFRRADVLLSTGRSGPATPIDQPLDAPRPGESRQGAATMDGRIPASSTGRPTNASLVPAGNLAGLPALCLPCGFTATGLPLAIQLVGRAFAEPTLLALGMWYQGTTDWQRRRPPVEGVVSGG